MTLSNSRYADLIRWLQQQKLISSTFDKTMDSVSGDAGTRKYYRFSEAGLPLLAVDADPAVEKNAEFLSVARAYASQGILVPEIKGVDLQKGFFCLQDLGNKVLGQKLEASNYQRLYHQALSILPELQKVVATDGGVLPPYDDKLLQRDFGLFRNHLLKQHLGLEISSAHQVMLDEIYLLLRDNFFQQPQVGVHRDFHCRNLMLLNDQAMAVIDFQDAAVGPITYDAVSLLRDCYVRWPDEEITALLKQWHAEFYQSYDWCQFQRWFDLTGIQRHLKAAGIFARLNHRDNKPAYLADIPRTLGYVVDIGKQYPELAEFAQWLETEVKPALVRSLDEKA